LTAGEGRWRTQALVLSSKIEAIDSKKSFATYVQCQLIQLLKKIFGESPFFIELL
jgi:hypothetical protein